MKLNWIEPSIKIENFEPDEYVAACYKLACQVGDSKTPQYGDLWKRPEYGGVSHSPSGTIGTCADANANRIITNDSGVITSIDEHNNQQGWISGGLDRWIDVNDDNICNPGDIIYWHTYSNDKKRRWNHWGIAEATDPSHPNHS